MLYSYLLNCLHVSDILYERKLLNTHSVLKDWAKKEFVMGLLFIQASENKALALERRVEKVT